MTRHSSIGLAATALVALLAACTSEVGLGTGSASTGIVGADAMPACTVPAKGVACATDAECEAFGAACVDGKCSCASDAGPAPDAEPDVIAEDAGPACTLPVKGLGCTIDTECQPYGAVCVAQRCACESDGGIQDAGPFDAPLDVEPLDAGPACTLGSKTVACKTDARCAPYGASCVNHRCACDADAASDAGPADAALDAAAEDAATCTLGLSSKHYVEHPAKCDTCMQQSCCTQNDTCASNPDCTALVTCTAFCEMDGGAPSTCTQGCLAQHAAGQADYAALMGCMSTSCSIQACFPLF